MKIEIKKVITILLMLGVFLSLAVFLFNTTKYNNKNQQKTLDSLQEVIQSKEYIIKRNAKVREGILDSIFVLKGEIRRLEVQDCLQVLRYEQEIEAVKKEVDTLTGSELGKLMTEKYEKYINNN